MKLLKKTISLVLTSTIMVSAVITSGINSVFAKEDTSKEKDYIVLTDSEHALESALELSSDSEILLNTDSDDAVVSKLSLSSDEVNQLKHTDGVVAVEKDITLTGNTSETDEVDVIDYLFKDVDTDDLNLWYLDAVGNDDSNGEKRIKIELLDSGVNLNKDIEVEKRVNLIEGDEVNPIYEDLSGHGTAMASVIGAKNNGIGVTGINPNAKIYSVRVLDDKIQAPLSRIIEGIQWGIDNNMDIINMSFGTNTNSAILREVIQKANEAGILLVSATGNDPNSGVQYPAAYPEVLAVGSMNENSEISDFTSVGDEMDVVAPGEKIETAGIFGTINGTNGTSISTAEVSAVASKILERNKSKSPEFVKGLILASAKKIQDGDVTTGAIDGNYALEIYDEYEKSYTPNKNIQEYVNPNDTTSYDTDGFVTGLWSSTKHAEMAQEAYDGIYNSTGNTMALIAKGAKIADSSKLVDINSNEYSFKDVLAFHGTGNYVASLKCAWRFVYCLHQSNKNGEGKTTAINNAAAEATNLLNSMNLSSADKNKVTKMIDTLKILHKIDVTEKGVVTDDRSLQSTKFKAMGLCMHIVGDTFAHRTLVPKVCKDEFNDTAYFPNTGDVDLTKTSNINGLKEFTQGTDSTYKLNTKKFKNRKSLKKSIDLYILEFRDIKWFCPAYPEKPANRDDTVTKKYEDDPNLFKRRYKEAELACWYLAEDGYKKNADICIFVPTNTKDDKGDEKYMRLWNLKNYVKSAGYDTNEMDDEDWELHTAYEQ